MVMFVTFMLFYERVLRPMPFPPPPGHVDV